MKSKNVFVTATIVILLFVSITAFSIFKFSVWNPFSSGLGMIEILWTDKAYTVVQNTPHRVAFSKAGDNCKALLDEYMENRNFQLKQQMGSRLTYSNGIEEEYIFFSANRYYAKWEWEK